MQNNDSTLVAVVLDRSGSMQMNKAEVIGGFNHMIEENKQLPGECLVTLVQFDDVYEMLYDAVPIAKVDPLTEETYVPRGFTRLFDAIGKTIDDVGVKLAAMKESERPKRVLVVILTDGMENASKEYTGQRVRNMIEHQRERYQWEFAFHGCQEGALKQAHDIGISKKNVMHYSADAGGTASALGDVSRGLRSVRRGGTYSQN